MYSDLKETRKLKVSCRTLEVSTADEPQEIYNASMKVKNAIPHPRIMGVIRECGGKMWMMERTSYFDCIKEVLTTRIMGQCVD